MSPAKQRLSEVIQHSFEGTLRFVPPFSGPKRLLDHDTSLSGAVTKVNGTRAHWSVARPGWAGSATPSLPA